MKKAITIKEIAEELGLSRNTVSKALNGQYVPSKTRELVLKKAQQMNYKSFNNDILKSKKYRILLLTGKPIHNMNFYLPLVNSLETYCFDNNYDFFGYTYKPDGSAFDKIATYIKSLNVDGIVAIECFEIELIKKLLGLKLPICFIDFAGYSFDVVDNFDLISSTDQKNVCDYIKTLVNKYDFKYFSFVGDYRHCLSFHERYMGMLRGLSRCNLSHSMIDDILEDDKTFDYGDVYSLKSKLMEFSKLPDCFVCCNDFVARKVATAIKELGYEIPRDTTIIGFDGVIESEQGDPKITTFNVDKTFLGEEAIRLLVGRIKNRNCPTRIVSVHCRLIERESTIK